jgi:DNA-directed RNA polymerase specialized sigma24 family protein
VDEPSDDTVKRMTAVEQRNPKPVDDRDRFATFARHAESRIRHALIPQFGPEGARDATAEALAYGWANWSRVSAMTNPVGYLYRVAQNAGRAASREPLLLPPVPPVELPAIEPGLPLALAGLSPSQRTAVWLVHGLQWRHTEVAELLGISPATARTHARRGLAALKKSVGGER